MPRDPVRSPPRRSRHRYRCPGARHFCRRYSGTEIPVERVRFLASVGSSISIRLGKCLLGWSITTCLLVTRNSRPSRSKKKPLAPVSGRLPSKVAIRTVVSSSDSIMGAFAHTNRIWFLAPRGSGGIAFRARKGPSQGERKPRINVGNPASSIPCSDELGGGGATLAQEKRG